MAEYTFITDIKIIKCRNISDIEISLNKDKHQHLIITGKNGSGKTSLLEALTRSLKKGQGKADGYANTLLTLEQVENQLKDLKENPYNEDGIEYRDPLSMVGVHKTALNDRINDFLKADIILEYNRDFSGYEDDPRSIPLNKIIIVFFTSGRDSNDIRVQNTISQPRLEEYSGIHEGANANFFNYLISMKAQQSFAFEENDNETYTKIKDWFDSFTNWLRIIFNDPGLNLEFKKESIKFNIVQSDGNTFDFHTLSHGYSALISIVSELISRMEAFQKNRIAYDMYGIVLIDEIETHLHVDLQKKVLPLLTSFFPNIQFIVSTHSPFVVSSISNAVICDLERKIITEDLSGYGYDVLIESFFGTELFSDGLKVKIERYRYLEDLNRKTDDEQIELNQIQRYLLNLPRYLVDNDVSLILKEINIKAERRGKL